MVCALSTPRWINPARAGLQSATEDVVNSATDLVWGEALAEDTVFYNIYFSDSLATLFDSPRAFATGTAAEIPLSLAPGTDFFAVRASRKGVVSNFSTVDDLEISSTAFGYPDKVHTTQIVNSNTVLGDLPVDGYVGFPSVDGYIQIGSEVFQYSHLDGYAGHSFVISDQDPFLCNDGYVYDVGTEVSLFRGFEEANTASFASAESCVVDPPYWVSGSLSGLDAAEDLGIGTVVRARWGPAIAPGGASQVYFNVYYSKVFDDIFSYPKGISSAQDVTIPELDPGEIYYFGVRATYFTNDWDVTQLDQASADLYNYPQSTALDDIDGYYFASDTDPLTVDSTDGFPDAGFIVVDSEILSYDSKTSGSFNIVGRDVFNFGNIDDHANGTEVRLYRGIEDDNLRTFRAVPSWDQGIDTPRMAVDNTTGPAYLQDADGYRDFPVDNLTEDHQESETENDVRPTYPYCGYRATNFIDLFTQNLCGTYIGGRQDGFGGGINIADITLQREELLLGLTGEPFILLRRKWTGKTCPSINHRQEHPQARCPMCYGTGFLGGYDRYVHPREILPGVDNVNGLLQLRAEPYQNDLELSAEMGLRQVDQLNVWCTALPQIKDRDILIRYVTDDQFNIIEEEFRYTVEFVNRNKILFNFDGRQQCTIKKLDKTSQIYTYPITLL